MIHGGLVTYHVCPVCTTIDTIYSLKRGFHRSLNLEEWDAYMMFLHNAQHMSDN